MAAVVAFIRAMGRATSTRSHLLVPSSMWRCVQQPVVRQGWLPSSMTSIVSRRPAVHRTGGFSRPFSSSTCNHTNHNSDDAAAERLRVGQQQKHSGGNSESGPAKELRHTGDRLNELGRALAAVCEEVGSLHESLQGAKAEYVSLREKFDSARAEAKDLASTTQDSVEATEKRVKDVENSLRTLRDSTLGLETQVQNGRKATEELALRHANDKNAIHKAMEQRHQEWKEKFGRFESQFESKQKTVNGWIFDTSVRVLIVGAAALLVLLLVEKNLVVKWLRDHNIIIGSDPAAVQGGRPQHTPQEVEARLTALLKAAVQRQGTLTWSEWWQGESSRLHDQTTAIRAVIDDVRRLAGQEQDDGSAAVMSTHQDELRFGDLSPNTKRAVARAVDPSCLSWNPPLMELFVM